MSSVNYGLKQKGIRLISAEEAYVKGKMDLDMPNMIISIAVGLRDIYDRSDGR